MSARDAVIVSTARTPIGRAYKGAFNATPGATLGALSLAPAIERAGIDAGEIEHDPVGVARLLDALQEQGLEALGGGVVDASSRAQHHRLREASGSQVHPRSPVRRRDSITAGRRGRWGRAPPGSCR